MKPRYWLAHGWMEEAEVVEKVCEYLKGNGYIDITAKRSSHERGPDVIATKDGKRLVVEAKGNREGHVKNSGDIYVDAMTLPGQLVRQKGLGTADEYAVAIRPAHRPHIEQALPALRELGIRALLVTIQGVEDISAG